MFGCEPTLIDDDNQEQHLEPLEPVHHVYEHERERVNSIEFNPKQKFEDADMQVIVIEPYSSRVN